jgi:excisionase family DNA binding protein
MSDVTVLLTIDQVAAQLQVHPRTVMRAISKRGLRAHQVAGRGSWRVHPEALEAWLEARANRPVTPSAVVPLAPIAAATSRARAPRGRARGVLAVTRDMGRPA